MTHEVDKQKPSKGRHNESDQKNERRREEEENEDVMKRKLKVHRKL